VAFFRAGLRIIRPSLPVLPRGIAGLADVSGDSSPLPFTRLS
jgi:hypothetical protein